MSTQYINTTDSTLSRFFYLLVCIVTAIIGHQIHGSVFWSIMDFFFAPLAILKWMIYQEVNLTIIKSAFDFFLR